MKTKLIPLLLALLFPLIASAHDFEVDGIYYNLNREEAGKVSVTYRGTSSSQYKNEYSGYLTIPSSVQYKGSTYKVTSIGNSAFYDCRSLTSVTIPNSVTSIGAAAFCYCTGLTSVTIPNSVTFIGSSAFSDCHSLTSVTIPNSVTYIGSSAFYYCCGLTSVTIPNSVTSIGNYIFHWCYRLTSVTIPNSVTSIGDHTFEYCQSLTSVTIPNSVTSIGDQAFYGCSGLTSVTIPNSVTSIGAAAFCYCSGLTSVTVKSKMPPTCESNTFLQVPVGAATLYVPIESVEAYKSAYAWKDFGNIEGVDFSRIDAKDNCFVVSDMEAYVDETAQLAVGMVNTEQITAFQCDVYLPEGLTVNTTDGEYDIFLSERATRSHSITAERMAGGTIRVVAYSSKSAAFSGNEGDLFTIDLETPSKAGNYTIEIKNIRLTDVGANECLTPDVSASVTVLDYVKGDSNGDGNVTITDAVNTVNYVLGRETPKFVFKAADVNNSGDITITDAVGTVNILMGRTSAPARAHALADEASPELALYIPPLGIAPGETKEVEVVMDNSIAISALQFDIALPEGLEVEQEDGEYIFDLASRQTRSHTISSALVDGKIRVISYSNSSADFKGNSGAVVEFPLVATEAFTADRAEILLTGIILTTADAVEYRLPDSVCMVSNTSGVEGVAIDAATEAEYFNLQGVRVENPTNGLYIRRVGNRTSKVVIN